MDFPSSWDETQQRLESCGTHSYIEETGCLQNTRSAASFYTKLDRLTLHSGSTRAQTDTRIHPPAPSLCLHSSETQEKTALPLSCSRVSQALDVISELHKQKAGMGLIECSSEFEVAWKAAEPAHNCEKINPYAVTNLQCTVGQTAPYTNQTSFIKAENDDSNGHPRSSSPAILHLSLHNQTQIHSRASWDTNGSHQGSVVCANSADTVTDSKQGSCSPTAEETNGMVVITSTDRAVFSDHNDGSTTSESSWSSSTSLCHNPPEKHFSFLSGVREGEGAAKVCKSLSATERTAPAKERSFFGWFTSGPPRAAPQLKSENEDSFFKSEGSEGQDDDQLIEVDGWCHLPQSSRPTDKAMQACWGLPEAEVRVWGAQILLALESLHEQGILCRDLNPRNVLLTSSGKPNEFNSLHEEMILIKHNVFTGKVCLTVFGQWSEVQSEISSKAMEQMYCAPGTNLSGFL